jgi:hypothetical protein
MTRVKILYIPSGDLLRYVNNEVMVIDYEIYPNIIEKILLINNQEYISIWREYNNIILPLVKEELEIVYD